MTQAIQQANRNIASSVAKVDQIVGSGAKFADQAKLEDHFARHRNDFGAKTVLEYEVQTDKFLTGAKSANVLEKIRPNGDVVRFNPFTNEFGVVSSGKIFGLTTNLIQQCIAKGLTWITLMRNDSFLYLCPVCGYPALDEPAYDSFGCASYNICPSCGTEFGYDDTTKKHADLRRKWIDSGMNWWSKNTPEARGWDPKKQLTNAGFYFFDT